MDKNGDAARLRALYYERIRDMNQAQFGALFDIGNQSMVSQYLTGHTPLNYDVVAKFARGLGCTIAEISPELARKLRADILPVLGRVAVKSIFAALIAIPPSMIPSKAQAQFDIIIYHINDWLRRCVAFWRRIEIS